MKRIFLYTLTCVTLVLSKQAATAQTPGFLGKRLSAGYNFTFFLPPSFLTDEDDSFLGFTCRHEANINYVVGRRVEVFGSFVFSDIRMKFYNSSFEIKEDAFSFKPKEDLSWVRVRAFGGGFKIYTNRYIAPVGKYLRFHLRYMQYGLPPEGLNGTFTYSELNGAQLSNALVAEGQLKTQVLSKSAINMGFGFGNQKVIGQRLILTMYTGTNFFIDSDWPTLAKNLRFYDNASVDNFLYGSMMKAIRGRYIFDISFGISYLIS